MNAISRSITTHARHRQIRRRRHVMTAVLVALVATLGGAHASQAQDSAAVRLYEHALGLEAEGDVAGAIEELGLVIQQFSGDTIVDDALLRRAALHWRSGDLGAAERGVAELLQSYPRTPSAAGGQVLGARIARARATGTADLSQVRDDLRRVRVLYGPEEFPDLEWRAEAGVVAGDFSLELGEPAAAMAAYADALREDSPSTAARARVGLARAFLAERAWLDAAELLQASVAGDDATSAEARQLLGLIHRLWVRPSAAGQLWKAARTLRLSGVTLDRPVGVAVTLAGEILVTDEGAPLVAQLQPDGALVWQQRPMNSRGHPWFGSDGVPFVPTDGSVVEPARRQRLTFNELRDGQPEPIKELVAGARGLFGEWILVHDDGRRAAIFDRQGLYLRSLIPSGRLDLADVAVDGRGRIYLLDRRQGRVVRYAPDGQADGQALTGTWSRAESLAIDRLENLYVLDRDAGTIDVYDPAGTRLARLGPSLPGGTTLEDARDLAVDGGGRIYVVDRARSNVVVIE